MIGMQDIMMTATQISGWFFEGVSTDYEGRMGQI